MEQPKRYTPDNIDSLKPDEIFVFGSNPAGQHNGGAARVALEKFGAIRGRGNGMQGQSYAIPTMQGGVETIKPFVDRFIEFAGKNPQLIFLVTRIGCGIAGFRDEDIAPLFREAFGLKNVVLPKSFSDIISTALRYESEMKGMVFHWVPIEFYPEDLAKAEGMEHKEKMEFFTKLRQEKRYIVKRESPEGSDTHK